MFQFVRARSNSTLRLFAADVLWVQSRIGVRRVDRELDGLVATLTNVIHAELAEQVSLETAAEEARFTVAADGRAVAIFDAHGKPLAASWSGLDLRDWPRSAPAGEGVWTERTPAGGWRLHARSLRFNAMSLTFLVGSTLADVDREQQEVREAMIVGFPIVLRLDTGWRYGSLQRYALPDERQLLGRTDLDGQIADFGRPADKLSENRG